VSNNNSALNEETTWILIVMLRNDCTLVRNIVKIMKNNDINILDKKAAWMIIMMLKNNHTLVKNAIKIVKNNNVNVFNEKIISVLDEQIIKILKIDKFFNFYCLYWELE